MARFSFGFRPLLIFIVVVSTLRSTFCDPPLVFGHQRLHPTCSTSHHIVAPYCNESSTPISGVAELLAVISNYTSDVHTHVVRYCNTETPSWFPHSHTVSSDLTSIFSWRHNHLLHFLSFILHPTESISCDQSSYYWAVDTRVGFSANFANMISQALSLGMPRGYSAFGDECLVSVPGAVPCTASFMEWLSGYVPLSDFETILYGKRGQFSPDGRMSSIAPTFAVVPSCAIAAQDLQFFENILLWVLQNRLVPERHGSTTNHDVCEIELKREEFLKNSWHAIFSWGEDHGSMELFDLRLPLDLRLRCAEIASLQSADVSYRYYIPDVLFSREGVGRTQRAKAAKVVALSYLSTAQHSALFSLDAFLESFESSGTGVIDCELAVIVGNMAAHQAFSLELLALMEATSWRPGLLPAPEKCPLLYHLLDKWRPPDTLNVMVTERMRMSGLPMVLKRTGRYPPEFDSSVFDLWGQCGDQPFVSPLRTSAAKLEGAAVSMVYLGLFEQDGVGTLSSWLMYAMNQTLFERSKLVCVVQPVERPLILDHVERFNMYHHFRGVYVPMFATPGSIPGQYADAMASMGFSLPLAVALVDSCTKYITFPSVETMHGSAFSVEHLLDASKASGLPFAYSGGGEERRILLIHRNLLLYTVENLLQTKRKLPERDTWGAGILDFWEGLGIFGLEFNFESYLPKPHALGAPPHSSNLPESAVYPPVPTWLPFDAPGENENSQDGGPILSHDDTWQRAIEDEVNSTFSCAPADPSIVIYNRVPKAGSTSLMTLLGSQSRVVRMYFKLCESIVSSNLTTFNSFVDKNRLVSCIRRGMDTMPPNDLREVVVKHQYFMPPKTVLEHLQRRDLPFDVNEIRRGDNKVISYINIVREPLARARSEFDYFRSGSRKNSQASLYSNLPYADHSFSECVRAVAEGNATYATSCADPTHQLRFFCGCEPPCFLPGPAALEIAKDNIRKHFLMVGTLDQFDESVWMLKKLLPSYFAADPDSAPTMTDTANPYPQTTSTSQTQDSSVSTHDTATDKDPKVKDPSQSSRDSCLAESSGRTCEASLSSDSDATNSLHMNPGNQAKRSAPLGRDLESIVRRWMRWDLELYDWVKARFRAMLRVCQDRHIR
eukprot:Rmarinus@m.20617